MKLTDVKNVFKMLCETQTLNEAMTGEFTMGFELEGCCTQDKDVNDEYFSLPGYHSNQEPRGGAKKLFDELNSTLGFGKGKIERDGSLNPSEDKGGWSFEYASPVIPFKPQNVEKVYSFLKNLPNLQVYTNDSCGFHTHISFPDISRNDAAWMVVCSALDDKMLDELAYFTKESGEKIDFFGYYAKPDRLQNMKTVIKNEDWRTLKRYLDEDKYELLRLHPDHGTIEWRGPRNFMNEGKIEDIHRYILKLYRVVQKFASYTLKNSIESSDGVKFTRDQLNKLGIRATDYEYHFNSDYEKKIAAKGENLVKAIESGKIKFEKLTPKQLDIVLGTNSYEVKRYVQNFFERDEYKEPLQKIDKVKFNILLEKYKRLRDESTFQIALRLANRNIDISSKLKDDEKKQVVKDLVRYILTMSSSRISDGLKELINVYNPFESDAFKKLSTSGMDVKTLIWLLNEYKDKLSPEAMNNIWKLLMQPKFIHYYSWLDEIPTNIQRKLVRSNPYNIQYIKHPDEAIMKWVLNKEPEVKDYVMGGI